MEQVILEAVKRNEKLILKGISEPQTYWIELIELNRNQIKKKSEQVNEWKQAVTLLEQYKWESYETETVHLDFVDAIKSERKIKLTSQERIVELYDLFLQGVEPSMKEMKDRFNVSDDTISKDIKRLRELFNERNKTINYDSLDNVYRLSSLDGNLLNISEITAILLIIYSSRAFNKEELEKIKNKLIENVSKESQRQINQFMKSFEVHYEPVQIEDILDMLRICLQAIQSKKVLSFYYYSKESKVREVIPYSLAFHKGIFYLLAFKQGDLKNLVSWRFDRMTNLKLTDKKIKYDGPYIEVGAHLKKSVWMFSGNLETVHLKIKEDLLEYLCREFPLVNYHSAINGMMDVEVTVNGLDAITFWVLQQAENVEVVSPSNFRQRIKEKIKKMSELYMIE